ncbi:MAG: ribonuclease Y, partial [Haliscomenobacter sp.]
MDIGIGLLIGLAIGAVIGYLLVNAALSRNRKKLQDEANNQADLQIKEARLTAKRLTDEAEMKAEKILDQ